MNDLVFILIKRGFGWNLVRSIFVALDNVAFFLFSSVMGVMYDIASVTANADLTEFIRPLYSRIYVILSIYMLFKVTISIIGYIINPDAMTDKNKGAGKLVTRIITALIMLLFMPYAFSFMNTLQSHIITNETIPKLVLGPGGNYSGPDAIGREIAMEAYDGTFIYEEGADGMSVGFSDFDEIEEHINDPVQGDNHAYKYHYIMFAGFAVGILLTLLTLSMCIDVSIRVFKLVILQIIAPIPIMSYIDPNEKDSSFSKWFKMYISTWLEVFIRLFVIYFILLVIQRLINSGTLLTDGSSALVKIALIIGLLFFAKDAPKFIYEALGMKAPDRGLFSGLGNILAAGAVGLGAVGAGMAVARSGIQTDDAKGLGKVFSVGKNIGKGLFAGTGSALNGAYAVGTAKDKQAKAALDARNKYLANQLSGNTLAERMKQGGINLATGYDIDREIANASAIEATAEKLRGYANGEGAKYFSDTAFTAGTKNDAGDYELTDANGNVHTNLQMSRNDLQLGIANASNTGGHVFVNGVDLGAANGSIVSKLTGDIDEFVGDQYMNAVDAGTQKDNGALGALRASYASAMGISQDKASSHRNSEIKKNQKSNATRKFTLQQKKGGK